MHTLYFFSFLEVRSSLDEFLLFILLFFIIFFNAKKSWKKQKRRWILLAPDVRAALVPDEHFD